MPSDMEVPACGEHVICDLHEEAGARAAKSATPDEVSALVREQSDEVPELPEAPRLSRACRGAAAVVMLGLVATCTTSTAMRLHGGPGYANEVSESPTEPVVLEVAEVRLSNTRPGEQMNLALVGTSAGKAPEPCHTAENGEVCYTKVIWAMSVGIRDHPEWYPNLTVGSSFEQVQSTLHKSSPQECQEPCGDQKAFVAQPVGLASGSPRRPGEHFSPFSPASLEPVGATSSGSAPWAGRCNPTRCPSGLTCEMGSEEKCCEAEDWDCCGEGDEKLAGRKYCPAEGFYTTMCGNGMCQHSEEDCKGHGGAWYGGRRCGDMQYVGCLEEEASNSVSQIFPASCSTLEECQCPGAYPFAGYRREGSEDEPRVTWTCLYKMPLEKVNEDGCIGGLTGEDYRLGVASMGFVAAYANPNFEGADPLAGVAPKFMVGQRVRATYMDGKYYGATIEEVSTDGLYKVRWDDGDARDRVKRADELQKAASVAGQKDGSDASVPESAPASDEPECRTVTQGEPCYNLIMWSMQVGVPSRPEWESGSPAGDASFREIQEALARSGNSGCPMPCPAEGASIDAQLRGSSTSGLAP